MLILVLLIHRSIVRRVSLLHLLERIDFANAVSAPQRGPSCKCMPESSCSRQRKLALLWTGWIDFADHFVSPSARWSRAKLRRAYCDVILPSGDDPVYEGQSGRLDISGNICMKFVVVLHSARDPFRSDLIYGSSFTSCLHSASIYRYYSS